MKTMTMGRRALASLLALGMLGFATTAGAQTMYRCGNKYQDRPCDAGQQGKAVGSTGTSAPAASGGAPDADCSRRGQDSQKVVWAWEGGASAERQVEDVNRDTAVPQDRKSQMRQLISDVYRQRGTANQVRARIESECMAEKEEKARAKALADALIKSGTKPDFGGSSPSGAPAATTTTTVGGSDPAAERKARCGRLSARAESVRNQQRSGGSAQAMDRLNQELRSITQEQSQGGC
jgi:hypothetical protein